MKAIVALAWLAVLLASASLSAASDDAAGAVPVAAAQPRRVYRRSSWPEVVGMSSSEAKKIICEHHWSCDRVHVIPAGYGVTMEYDTRRVRVFLDSDDKVVTVPRIG